MRSGSADESALRSPDLPNASREALVRPRFPGLEGIRALAASMVVVHHAASLVGSERAGVLSTPAAVMDMGVAVFFVLSGFLIYRPFVAARIAGERPLRIRTFWWRRALRIVPAYWAALTILWATGSFSLGHDWWRYYGFLQIYDAFTTLGGIVPAWSLDTEMVFYLFIPVWSLLIGRLLGRGRSPGARAKLELGGVAVLLAAGYVSRAAFSSIDRVWVDFPGRQPVLMRDVSFSWFPNNVDLFATGMGIAVLSAWAASEPRLRQRLDRLAAPAGAWWAAAVVLFIWFAYRVGAPAFNGGYQGWYWQQRQLTFAAIGACLLVPAAFGDQDRGLVRRVLRSGPVLWVGVVSYGFYLWHQDLLERIPGWLDRAPDQVPLAVALVGAFGLGLAAAAASWYLLEQPLQRRWKRLL